jgi:hypothetical protein
MVGEPILSRPVRGGDARPGIRNHLALNPRLVSGFSHLSPTHKPLTPPLSAHSGLSRPNALHELEVVVEFLLIL